MSPSMRTDSSVYGMSFEPSFQISPLISSILPLQQDLTQPIYNSIMEICKITPFILQDVHGDVGPYLLIAPLKIALSSLAELPEDEGLRIWIENLLWSISDTRKSVWNVAVL